MSNHLHIVVKLCPHEAESLSDDEVVERWSSLFKGPLLVQRWRERDSLQPAEIDVVNACIAVYRKRLASLSWFMKCLNEPIARQANKEDGCTGHFREARYKSQALLTEEALLSAMAYVDLNPVLAAMADTPEASEHTSIRERIRPQFNLNEAVKGQIELRALISFEHPIKPLLEFDGAAVESEQLGILFSLTDYLQLVDFTGRCIRDDKRGAIPNHLPPILQRLNLDAKDWFANATQFESRYRTRFSKRPKQLQSTG